jgi:DNA processing protein
MTDEGGATDEEVRARIALSLLVEPGDRRIGQRLAVAGASATVQELVAGRAKGYTTADLGRAIATQLQRAANCGAECVIPARAGWPRQLDDLGDCTPYLLWQRGEARLRPALLRSVAVVGARACTHYGRAIAQTLGSELARRGWAVVSGGAFGIDAAAHAGALAVDGTTVLVTAGGVDRPYPQSHEALYARVAGNGAVVSEAPLGVGVARHRFLVRNRLIAALSRGTVIVEAARRSGARATAEAAHNLTRHVMAVPGPVTSDMSIGCHELVRNGQAVLVTGVEDVVELVSPLVANVTASSTATAILAALAGNGPSTVASLMSGSRIQRGEVEVALAALEGSGAVVNAGGLWTLKGSGGT